MIDTSFIRLDAAWTVAQALEVLSAVRAKRVIVHRLDPQKGEFFYAYVRDQLLAQLQGAGAGVRLVDALNLHEYTATPVTAGDQSGLDGPHVVVADGQIVGLAVPGTRGVPENYTAQPRNLSAEAPHEIAAGAEAPIVVKLGALDDKPVEDGKTVTVAIGDELKLVLMASGAVAIKGATDATIKVSADEATQLFTLRGAKVGDGKVTVYAFRNGQGVGSINVAVRVVAAAADTTTYERTIAVHAVDEVADLALNIFEDKDAATYRMMLVSKDLSLNYAPFGPIKLAGDVEKFFADIYTDIEGILNSTASVQDKLAKIATSGNYLAEKVMPPELRAKLWSLRGKIKSVQVQSAEPWVPWELCKMSNAGAPGAIEEGGFLSEEFEVTRWLFGVGQRADLSMKSLGVVVPGDSGLAAAGAEAAYFNGLAGPSRTVTKIPAKPSELRNALAGGTYDVLHFTGHGLYHAGNADRSRMELDGGVAFTPMDVSGVVANLGRAHPVVFLNACEIGRAGQALGGTAGWPQAFLRAGAGAFVGAYWSVADATASTFASAFYDALLNDKLVVGAAAQAARAAVRKASDPTWLSYVVYAHPCARVAGP
jgi:CHAT domain-containing protein/uncharacterized protein associated with vWA-MoxR-VMAP ternary system